MIKTLEEALNYISELETENKELRKELEYLRSKNVLDVRSMMNHGCVLIMILL